MVNTRLAVIQMMDNTFPIGLFNQSYGFEYFVSRNKISDDKSFYRWLHLYMTYQLQYNDLIIVQEIFRELKAHDQMPAERIVLYNDLLYAQNLAAEVRRGNSRTGRQFLDLVIRLFHGKRLLKLNDALIAQQTDPHPATVYAVTGYSLDMLLPELLETYVYGVVSSLIQNAVRGIPIGQTKAQQMLMNMHEEIGRIVQHVMTLDTDDFGRGLPGYEIAQMRHETLFARMFMS